MKKNKNVRMNYWICIVVAHSFERSAIELEELEIYLCLFSL